MLPASQILEAERRIRPHIVETAVHRSPAFSTASGAVVVVKAEHEQVTGSFKLRGAFNKLLTLPEDDRRRGVVAASSGNHGAAVAHACHVLGIKARVFVPEAASPAKVARILAKGAQVVHFGTDGLDTEVEARRVAVESGACYVSPYNDVAVMAGQGTLALELLRQAGDLTRVYVAVGGGGLIGGMASYLAEFAPEVRVVGVLPEASPVMSVSVAAGHVVEMATSPTLSDGTAGGMEADSVTFEICRTLVHEWMTVSEEEIAAAMRQWAKYHPGEIEGAAGVAIAGCLRDAGRIDGARVAIVICGGNIAHERWTAVTGQGG
ncbi:MAG: threonine/serine dehydratase [Cytophagaceae bacterium]|nr:threonine/serine dehydratase [Gemmatimonadaceae bacterium]